MIYKELAEMLLSSGIPCVYHHWNDNSSPPLPYIIYLFSERNDFFADNDNYQRIEWLNVELYTENKDFALENKIEKIFQSHEITFHKTELYIDSEKMYEILYEMEIFINEGDD